MSRVCSFLGVGPGRARSSRPRSLLGPAVRVGLFVFALYLLSYGGGPHAVDEIGQLGVTASLVKRGALDANELFWTIPAAGNRSDAQVEVGPTGDVWSLRGPGVPLAMAPWYALAMAVPRLDLSFTSLLFNTAISAATAALLVWLGLRVGLSSRLATAGGLIYGIAGMAWPYAKLGFGEPLIAFGVVGAALAGTAGALGAAAAGGFVVLAASTKWSAGALGLPFALSLLFPLRVDPHDRGPAWRVVQAVLRRLVPFGVLGALGLAALGYYNWAHYGSALATGYGSGGREEFTTPPLYGLLGLLVSAYRGIVWFAPGVVAGALVLPVAYRRAPALALAAGGVGVVTLATFAAWWTWWGGYTWGPRFLLPACPLLCLMIPLAWEGLTRGWRWLVGMLVVLSGLVQLPGVLVDFNPFEKALRETAPGFPRSGGIWGPAASPILAHARALVREGSCALDLTWWHCGHFDPVLLLALLLPVVVAALALWRRRVSLDALTLVALVGGVGVLLVRGPASPNGPQRELLAAAAARDAAAAPDDGTVVLASPEVPALWAHDRWRGATYGFNRDDLPDVAEARTLLGLAVARHPRLWLLAANVPRDDPKNQVERWLDENAFATDERSFGSARLRGFVTGAQALAPAAQPIAVFDGGAIRLAAARLLDGSAPVRVELLWQASRPAPPDLKVFVHLYVGPHLVGQRDGRFDEVGRYLVAPSQPAGGEGSVEVGLYRGDGARLAAVAPDGRRYSDDRVPVGSISLGP
ncbi:MAG TPA: hypothetical protein VFC93_04270 [Chloroflexota bacterium]|nr:hypothetical protein [Chloroflexota bacterium]